VVLDPERVLPGAARLVEEMIVLVVGLVVAVVDVVVLLALEVIGKAVGFFRVLPSGMSIRARAVWPAYCLPAPR